MILISLLKHLLNSLLLINNIRVIHILISMIRIDLSILTFREVLLRGQTRVDHLNLKPLSYLALPVSFLLLIQVYLIKIDNVLDCILERILGVGGRAADSYSGTIGCRTRQLHGLVLLRGGVHLGALGLLLLLLLLLVLCGAANVFLVLLRLLGGLVGVATWLFVLLEG